MKRLGIGLLCFTAVGVASALWLSGCGKSLSSEEKAKALGAIGLITSQGTSARSRLIAYIQKSKSQVDKPQTVGSNQMYPRCTPGTQTTDGMTFTTACPDSGETVVTLTGAGPFTKTCGAVTYTATDVNSTISYKLTDSIFALSMNLGASVDGLPLACSFGASINSLTASQVVTDEAFDCKYNGIDISKDDVASAKCETSTTFKDGAEDPPQPKPSLEEALNPPNFG